MLRHVQYTGGGNVLQVTTQCILITSHVKKQRVTGYSAFYRGRASFFHKCNYYVRYRPYVILSMPDGL